MKNYYEKKAKKIIKTMRVIPNSCKKNHFSTNEINGVETYYEKCSA